MLENIHAISKRTGRPYYGAAALVSRIFSKPEENYYKETLMEEYKELIKKCRYANFDEQLKQ